MKSVLLSAIVGLGICAGAMASDNGAYTETTETYTEYVEFSIDASVERPVAAPAYTTVREVRATPCSARRVRSSMDVRPCDVRRVEYSAPVRVKTHTEVIDHYQLYQPVTQYVPAGVYSVRRTGQY